MPLRTRFAPSPTGWLHLGHALSALKVWELGARIGAEVLLRIEDIDPDRCRPDYTAGIYEDLHWLGLAWPQPVRIQSQHMADYRAALAQLEHSGFAYPCFCSRKDIAAHPQLRMGAEGPLYPGTCRNLPAEEVARRLAAGLPHSWRLNAQAILKAYGPLSFTTVEEETIPVDADLLGDAIVARRDVPTSYHLAVVVDDALQGITHIVRGADLLAATHTHRLLQAALTLPAPLYSHHALLTDATGAKLSKRDGAEGLRVLRARGVSAAEVRARVLASA